MSFVIVLMILVAVVLLVSSPMWRDARGPAGASVATEPPAGQATELAELEAAREAKYREIRDAELDHRTGKLSDEDFAAIDGALRAEAVEILERLDRLGYHRVR